MMKSFLAKVTRVFDKIIKKYNFSTVSVDNREVFLIDEDFALSIFHSHEGVEIYYISIDKNNNILQYRISNFLQNRFTDKDRSYYVNTHATNERITSELRVLASGLLNHWSDLLSGEKEWFQNYRGEGMRVNKSIYEILYSYLK